MEDEAGKPRSSSELRHNSILDKWVIISPARGKRPTDFKSTANPSQSHGPCPFCLHHEHECAPEIFRIPESQSHWKVRVIENLYPAVSMKEKQDIHLEFNANCCTLPGFGANCCTLPGFGSHDVVIETPEHSMTLASMTQENIFHVLLAYRTRILQLAKNQHIKYIQVFKNHGETAGASMRHSHSQIISLPIVPTDVVTRVNNAKEYFLKTKKCNFCELSSEIQSRNLLIDESSHFISFVTYAPSFPFETWIAPKEHASCYEEIQDEHAMDLAYILRHTLRKMNCQLGNPPFNYMIHSSPLGGLYEPSYCHWFIQIVPQLTRIGGFEIASGCYINPIFPEDVASILRKVNL